MVFLWMIGCLLTFTGSLNAQTESKSIFGSKEVCSQPKEERDALINEAEREEFNVRHVEFVGNTYTRARDLFRRISPIINEGDIFARANLEKAVKRMSKMKAIYPITMDNVEVRLDRSYERAGRTYKVIDIIFCIEQKPKR
ncbi:MAG: hypothetical protein KF685_12525 [Acidobacteria bacterium]|nr:hypothetical protein [Acidobacteriota bacterium]